MTTCYNLKMVLYKYAGDSGFRILEDLRLKITPPNEFNDPFEITPRSQFAVSLASQLDKVQTNPEYYRQVYEEMHQVGIFGDTFEQFIDGLPEALRRDFAKYKKSSKQELETCDMKSLDDASKYLGILCLSKPPNSIPMWSYYANHHRGVVFGLDIDRIGGPYSGPSGLVNYRKQRARINPYIPPSLDAFIRLIFTKSVEWKHEHEYRRVFQLSGLICRPSKKAGVNNYFWNISGDAIQEIIFGCRASDRLKRKIFGEIDRRKKTFGHIRLLRCVRHPSKFELKIIPATRR
jgi:hypothetical protein